MTFSHRVFDSRRLNLKISLLCSAATLILAARLEYDLRKLKVKCCDVRLHDDGASCSYQTIGQESCPNGTELVQEPGWDCDPFCTEFTESLLLMSLGDIQSAATENGLRNAVEETKSALLNCAHGDPARRRTASSARCNLAVVILMRHRGIRFERLAHRLLSWAVVLDSENEAAISNLKTLGGSAACNDLAENGDPSLDDPCADIPGYHTRMLHDRRRNEAYRRAIEWAIARKGNGSVVVDIGAGSGILSLMAAQARAPNPRLLPRRAARSCAHARSRAYVRRGAGGGVARGGLWGSSFIMSFITSFIMSRAVSYVMTSCVLTCLIISCALINRSYLLERRRRLGRRAWWRSRP
jgi:hypothetical protein